MTIAVPEVPFLWAEALKMGADLKNRLPHKHQPSSTTLFESFYSTRLTISDIKLFGNKCYLHI
jgi:hypothetical protein